MISLLLFFTVSVQANTISVDDYLSQVETQDPGVRATAKAAMASKQSLDSYRLQTGIAFFSQMNLVNDERPTANPPFQGTKTTAQSYAVGLNQKTDLGLNWALSQNLNHVSINGASPLFITTPRYYDAFTKADLTVNLWKNFAGGQIHSDLEKSKQENLSQEKISQFSYDQKIAQAESLYWQLYYAKELQTIQTENLARANKLLNWTLARKEKNFAENSDVLQAKAAVAQRQLDVESNTMQVRELERQFNSLRGSSAQQVSESLHFAPVDESKLSLQESSDRKRKDLVAQNLSTEASRAQFLSYNESLKPQLDLSLSYAWQGRDSDLSTATSKIYSDRKPYWIAGVNFVLPLDFSLTNKTRQAFAAQAEAQELKAARYTIDAELAWKQLVDQGRQLRTQLRLLSELEQIQKKKAEEEHIMLSRGRTTTFQVLNFEQDFINTRSQKIAVETAARQFIANLRLFE